MKLTRVIAIAVIAASSGIGYVQAQSLSDGRIPAEFPPESYKGRQYVDSTGCVFIKAGIDGNVTWVPRVSRSRKIVCGFQPSLARTATARAPVVKTVTAKPEVITVAAPKPRKVTRKAPVKTVAVASVAPVKKVITKPTIVAVAPVQPVKKPAKVVKKTTPAKMVKRQTACPGAGVVSRKYLNQGYGAVRCGPQTTPYVSYSTGSVKVATTIVGVTAAPVTAYTPAPVAAYTPAPVPAVRRVVNAPTVTTAPSTMRIAPRRVYENQQSSQAGIQIPAGYKRVWDDDRLNPNRAHQTLAGIAQMDLTWTKTVPRYLIDGRTGRDITYKYPGLQYPYTSFEDQSDAGVLIATRGVIVEDPIRVVKVSSKKRARKVVKPQKATTLISTRSSVPKKVASAATHRFVQAGAYADTAQARRAAQRLANAGLPAKLGKAKHKGKTYSIAVVGPFKSQTQLMAALQKVRAAGFKNAYLKK